MQQLAQGAGLASIVALTSLVTSIVIVISKKWHGRFSLDSDLTGIQKFHKQPVPRIGGVALVVGVLSTLIGAILFVPEMAQVLYLDKVLLLFFAGTPVFIAGVIEDITKKVAPSIRLAAAFCSAGLACYLMGATLDNLDIPFVDTLFVYSPFAVFVTMLAVSGGINGINIIDGCNGVASIATMFMTVALGYLAWIAGDRLLVNWALFTGFAVLGFFFVNYPTGKIFCGDGGAYLMGFCVSELAVLLLARNTNISTWQVFAITAYPVIEVLFSIYRRKFVRQVSPGSPDRLHLHSLIFRRISCIVIPGDLVRPWVRNSSVACFVGLWVGFFGFLAVVAGERHCLAGSIVLAEFLLYVALYRRLVRWHWSVIPKKITKLLESKRDER